MNRVAFILFSVAAGILLARFDYIRMHRADYSPRCTASTGCTARNGNVTYVCDVSESGLMLMDARKN